MYSCCWHVLVWYDFELVSISEDWRFDQSQLWFVTSFRNGRLFEGGADSRGALNWILRYIVHCKATVNYEKSEKGTLLNLNIYTRTIKIYLNPESHDKMHFAYKARWELVLLTSARWPLNFDKVVYEKKATNLEISPTCFWKQDSSFKQTSTYVFDITWQTVETLKQKWKRHKKGMIR